MLIILEKHIVSTAEVDALISACLPDPNTQPQTYANVTKFMLHTACRMQPTTAVCMQRRKPTAVLCSKKFPSEFIEATEMRVGWSYMRLHYARSWTKVCSPEQWSCAHSETRRRHVCVWQQICRAAQSTSTQSIGVPFKSSHCIIFSCANVCLGKSM